MTTKPHNPLEGPSPEMSIGLHDNSDEPVSIIIVNKDTPDYLNICIQSIIATSANNNYEIIVVDNGSDQDTQSFLDDLDESVKIIRNKENLMWAKAANQGAMAANKNSKYLIFMHADVVILNPSWIDLLIGVSDSSDSGIVGLQTMSYYIEQQKVDFLQEWCLLMTRQCWEACGPWPEELPQVGGPFIMTVKTQVNGFNPQYVRNPIAHHYSVFGASVNSYEKWCETSMAILPGLLQKIQGLS